MVGDEHGYDEKNGAGHRRLRRHRPRFAELLAADGYNVVSSRGAEALERVARDLEARFGTGTMVVAQDLGEPAAAERVFAAVTRPARSSKC